MISDSNHHNAAWPTDECSVFIYGTFTFSEMCDIFQLKMFENFEERSETERLSWLVILYSENWQAEKLKLELSSWSMGALRQKSICQKRFFRLPQASAFLGP